MIHIVYKLAIKGITWSERVRWTKLKTSSAELRRKILERNTRDGNCEI